MQLVRMFVAVFVTDDVFHDFHFLILFIWALVRILFSFHIFEIGGLYTLDK